MERNTTTKICSTSSQKGLENILARHGRRYLFAFVACGALSALAVARCPTAAAQVDMSHYTEATKLYRTSDGQTTQYFFGVEDMLKFLPSLGQPSPLVYDFSGSGAVDVEDLILALSGYGQQSIYDIAQITVLYQASSGWPAEVDGAYFAIVKPTCFDETTCISGIRTWFVEVVEADGTTTRMWFH